MVDRSLPLRWPRAPQRRMTFLVVLLVLSLGLTAVLAYQAQDAARSHRATAERALHDYASFAALEFSVNSKEGIYANISEMLHRPDVSASYHHGPRSYDSLPPLSAASSHCALGPADTLPFYFQIELRAPRIIGGLGCAPPALRSWLADTVSRHAHAYYKPTWDQAYIIARVLGEPELVSYVVRRDDHDVPVIAYGFATRLAPFAAMVFEDVYRYFPFFPQALVGKTPNDSMMSVRVTDPNGDLLYASPMQYPHTYVGTETADKFGGFTVDVALRPSMADQLVIGGLPRSRMPLLLALLGLSVALVVAALLQLRREYELARLRADFISSISHELRTPLAHVRMFAETLLLGRVRSEEEPHRSLAIIDQEARRLTHLVENVLLFSRAERRVVRIALEPTELADELREVVEAFAPIAAARHVEVVTELEEGVVAPVDRDALRQTMLNLLDNAVKYGPVGQRVTVRLASTNGYAVLSVEDEGPGIAPKERSRIWEPFYRLECDANSAIAGSGIGLSVVSEIVALHGGRVHVEGARSGGARFVVELPRVEGRGTRDEGRGMRKGERGGLDSEAHGSGGPDSNAASRSPSSHAPRPVPQSEDP